MQVKGLELPAYDPRGMKGQGLAFATSNRGGCHLRANMLNPEILGIPKMIDRFATLGKAGLLINMQNLNAILDSLSLCKFTAFAMKEDYYARLLSAVTGETMEPQELLRIGERIWNTERLFNLAAGCTRADDSLPPRLPASPSSAGRRRARSSTCSRCSTSTTSRAAGTPRAGRASASCARSACPRRSSPPHLRSPRRRCTRDGGLRGGDGCPTAVSGAVTA